eukprot:4002101-Lingulodinium_polyedra.AAC.1
MSPGTALVGRSAEPSLHGILDGACCQAARGARQMEWIAAGARATVWWIALPLWVAQPRRAQL